MKTIRLCICLFAVFCYNSLYAQEEEGNGFLFPQFENGVVIFKNGTRTAASLNYNMLQQKMLFKDKENNMLEFANIPAILAVTIGERRFFPITSNGVFYEEIKTGDFSFFVQYKAIMMSQGKEAGYGGYSQTSAITSIGSIQGGSISSNAGSLGSGRVNLEINEKFKLRKERLYYIKSGKNYKRFVSAKTLGKLFKGQASKIEGFAKEQSIDFTKTEDVARIVEYGFSMMNKNQ